MPALRPLLLGLLTMGALSCARSPCREELTFHTNGRLKRGGKVCHGLKQGLWMEDYADGTLCWQGTYVNDTLEGHPPADSSGIQLTVLGEGLRAGQEAPVRIQVGDLHPSALRVTVSNGTVDPPGDPDMYDLVLRPDLPGGLYVKVEWTDPRDSSRTWSSGRHLRVMP